jgi:competence protein ComEC
VLKVHTADHSLLQTGDVEVEAQAALVRAGVDLRAEVIKVPHHGSPYQDPDFLRAVHASVAVVSVGRDNDYGHPSALLLAEMAREGARTLRTDLDGDVAVCERDGHLAVVARSRDPP